VGAGQFTLLFLNARKKGRGKRVDACQGASYFSFFEGGRKKKGREFAPLTEAHISHFPLGRKELQGFHMRKKVRSPLFPF